MTPLKVLIVEDNDDDAELTISSLEQNGFQVESKIVDQRDQLIEALHETEWDIVISDYSMPQFNGLEALKVTKAYNPDLPFIIISGTIGEEVAVEAMRLGAHDYLMKDNLRRLTPAVKRELEEAKNRAEKRRVQEMLVKRDEERAFLLKILEQKTSQLEEILYISSHDLKSPLVNISGFAKELEDSFREIKALVDQNLTQGECRSQITQIVEGDASVCINTISENTAKLSDRLQGLTQISQLEKETVLFQQVDMNEVVNIVMGKIRQKINGSHVEISVEPLVSCFTDQSLITLVVAHLLDNAVSFLSPERAGRICVKSTQDDLKSTYCIEDNGIGIEPSYQKRIFDIFHQLNPSNSNAMNGSGLGLTIAQRLLNKLLGEIWIESRLGEGSKFYFSLPASFNTVHHFDNLSTEMRSIFQLQMKTME